jgi:microcystin-dependent protein
MASASEMLLGSIGIFAGNFAPRGYALCQGQLLSIAQNTALFSILGTTYGGNGTTTFALPDLRGRFAVGQGNGPGLNPVTLGELAGANSVTMNISQMPMHNHLIACDTGFAGVQSPANALPASLGDAINQVNGYSNANTGTMNAQMCGTAGGNQPIGIQNPMLGLNYIIAIQGIFPSRN